MREKRGGVPPLFRAGEKKGRPPSFSAAREIRRGVPPLFPRSLSHQTESRDASRGKQERASPLLREKRGGVTPLFRAGEKKGRPPSFSAAREIRRGVPPLFSRSLYLQQPLPALYHLTNPHTCARARAYVYRQNPAKHVAKRWGTLLLCSSTVAINLWHSVWSYPIPLSAPTFSV